MNNHSFEVQVATDYDVETALLLNSMAFWTETNAANKKHKHDDRIWLFNSYEAWTSLFPYWSSKQMRRILANAESSGLIITGNYNKRAADLTKWYSLTDKAIEYYPRLKASLSNTPAQTGKPPAQTGNALPYSYTDPNTVTTTTTVKATPSSSFESQVLSLKVPTDTRSDKIFLENIYHHMENNSKNLSNIYKKRSGIVSILKKLFTLNELFCSDGFIDQETKKKKELDAKKREQEFLDAQERQHAKRMDEYKRSQKNA